METELDLPNEEEEKKQALADNEDNQSTFPLDLKIHERDLKIENGNITGTLCQASQLAAHRDKNIICSTFTIDTRNRKFTQILGD